MVGCQHTSSDHELMGAQTKSWVYRDKTFMELRDVIGTLMGAVVEVYFGMRHYYLRDKKFDMFQAEIQQIRIVKPGSSIVTSGFECCNAREGLLDVIKVGLTNGGDKEDVRARDNWRMMGIQYKQKGT
ncbi:hypothetical protein M405DRAFT_907697 [Rhizopogon salebrosus TDB-379]|nr:hypothetical protein M405DRAFT_907697 [Rhizopogon salebrosus TDB-379]